MTFHVLLKNGPGAGKSLALSRAPIYLRIVENGGVFDALDLLTDTPEKDEKIYVYKLAEKPTAFISCRRSGGKHKGCSHGMFCNYEHLSEQPKDWVMRTCETWRDWCTSHLKKEESCNP